MNANWLTDLEKKVETAVAELEKLRDENVSQKTKIAKLEKELKEARKEGKSASGWEQERENVRQRVEKLSAELERLL
jgi:predicted RNase H-like nuclease (RuvC/YqgF family)